MTSQPQPTTVSQQLLLAAAQNSNNNFNLQIPSMHLKLERDTHSLWRTTVVSSLETFDLESHALNPNPPPAILPISAENPTETPNPDYITWKKRDRFVLLWLKSTLGARALAIVARCSSTREAWLAIDRSFQAQTRANRMSMKAQLQSLSKGSSSMLEYIEKKRAIADSLAENLHPVDDEDLIGFILQGLDSSYNSFVSAFMINSEGTSIDELVGLLLQEEARLESDLQRQAALLPSPPAPIQPSAHAAARYSGKTQSNSYNSGSSSGASSNPNNRGNPNRRRPHCQLCNRPGHEAIDCWQRDNIQDFPPRRANPRASNRQANNVQFNSPSSIDPQWYFDSGATDHVSPDLSKLQIADKYHGTDKLQVGNGQDSTTRPS